MKAQFSYLCLSFDRPLINLIVFIQITHLYNEMLKSEGSVQSEGAIINLSVTPTVIVLPSQPLLFVYKLINALIFYNLY